MSSRVYLNFCSKEIEISSGSKPKSKFSKFCDKNNDVILIVAAGIFALFAVLTVYGYIPIQPNPLFAAGMFAGAAEIFFLLGLMKGLVTRGCIVVKNDSPTEQQVN